MSKSVLEMILNADRSDDTSCDSKGVLEEQVKPEPDLEHGESILTALEETIADKIR